MKLIIDDKIPFIRGRAEKLAEEVVYLPGAAITAADVRQADALIVRTRTLCNRQLLEGSRVRFIATATIGYDHLDTHYLREAGIQWTNCPGCNATSVAQYVRQALLELQEAGYIRLSEATLGIVGYGHVGRAVYKALQPYVKQILVNDPPLKERLEGLDNLERLDNLENLGLLGNLGNLELLGSLAPLAAQCDIISLHTPLTTSGPHPTHHLVDDRFLCSLQRRPILVNAARGGVVDEEALLRALGEGRVRQAVIDTWEGEPTINRQLLQEVFIATPHIAGYSADGKANATRMALEALARWKGREQSFRIEPPTAEPGRTGLAYRPTEDSKQLKTIPENFEKLRGNYLLRRE